MLANTRVRRPVGLVLVASLVAVIAGCGAQGAAAAGPPRPAADSSGRRTPAMERRLLDGARPTPPSVRLRITAFETFVAGKTRTEFLAAMRERQGLDQGYQRGAQRPMSTHWRMSWAWEQRFEGTMCTFRSVTVFIDYQTHFVRLDGPIAEDPTVQEWWNAEVERTFVQRLHELRLLRDAASETQKKLRTMFSANCELLAREASQTANRDVQDLGERMRVRVISDPPADEP